MISPLVATAIWQGLLVEWRVAALRGEYADPSHECHNVDTLARQMLAMRADDPDWAEMGLSGPNAWVN